MLLFFTKKYAVKNNGKNKNKNGKLEKSIYTPHLLFELSSAMITDHDFIIYVYVLKVNQR